MTPEQVIAEVREKKVRFIRLWFTDILGHLKSFTITDRQLEHALKEGMGFDGSSIEGFARIYESDLLAKPDPSTFALLPGPTGEPAAARMFCDIFTPDGNPYPSDPRYVLRRNLQEAAKMGFRYMVGPELEYFYFRSDKSPEPLDSGGYFDSVPLDEAHDLRRDTILALESMGIPVEYAHHEVAPSQHEIDLRFCEALEMADRVITYRYVVKETAESKGVYASFMPKPIPTVNGSGMHTHQSLFTADGEERNAFFDPNDPYHLSEIARHYLAGILRHSREICCVTNQWVNSYKRLVPGYEAPVYICWGRKNRSALVRVPGYAPGRERATRIEVRFPDPACNPYLAFSVMLAAGLEGIRKKYPLPEPVEVSAYEMDRIEREAKNIETLPGSLAQAIYLAEGSDLLKRCFGEELFEKFLANKRLEWEAYRTQVTDYEIRRYLPIL